MTEHEELKNKMSQALGTLIGDALADGCAVARVVMSPGLMNLYHMAVSPDLWVVTYNGRMIRLVADPAMPEGMMMCATEEEGAPYTTADIAMSDTVQSSETIVLDEPEASESVFTSGQNIVVGLTDEEMLATLTAGIKRSDDVH